MNNPTNKPNIIWIVVDSVRNYTAKDKYGKLDVMQEFAKESVEFTNAVSSAASTLMSTSAMFSSRQAYYISRDFATFNYDRKFFPPLTDILKSNGYNIHTIHHYIYMRKKMSHILHCVPQKEWPKKINKCKELDDDEMNSIFLKLMRKGLKEPFFLHMHYNVVTGNKFTSQRVRSVLRKLKEKNLYDNSITILCSDHGYPDPIRTKFTLKQMVLEGHDLFVTDDNIMIPLIIKYPGCQKNKKIHNVVSSLDITPTILSLLNIPYKNYGFEGLNLLDYVKRKKTPNRKVRTDTRYYFQPNKIASLRDDKYKYTYYFEMPKGSNEEFFDIKNDKLEKKNLIHSENKIIINKLNEFRREFNLSEKRGVEVQQEYLGKKFKTILNNTNFNKNTNQNKILIFGTANVLLINVLLNNLLKISKNATIDLVIKRNEAKKLKIKSEQINFIYSNLNYSDLKKRLKKIKKKRYDLIIIPLANNLCIRYNPIFKIARKLKASRTIKVDYNITLINESNMWLAIFKDIRKDLLSKLMRPSNFAGNLVGLAKKIMFDKYF